MKALNEKLNKEINDSEQRRKDLQNEFNRSIDQHREEINAARAGWKKESDDFVNTIKQRDEEIRQLKKQMYDKEQAWDEERRNLKR